MIWQDTHEKFIIKIIIIIIIVIIIIIIIKIICFSLSLSSLYSQYVYGPEQILFQSTSDNKGNINVCISSGTSQCIVA